MQAYIKHIPNANWIKSTKCLEVNSSLYIYVPDNGYPHEKLDKVLVKIEDNKETYIAGSIIQEVSIDEKSESIIIKIEKPL